MTYQPRRRSSRSSGVVHTDNTGYGLPARRSPQPQSKPQPKPARTYRYWITVQFMSASGPALAGVSVSLTYPISSSEQFPRISRLIAQAAPALAGASVVAFSRFADVPSEDK